MKKIEIFEAYDGQRFDAESECVKYEDICAKCEHIMSSLPVKPDSCDFANGSGYIKHEASSFYATRKALLGLARPIVTCQAKWVTDAIDDEDVHLSWPQRIIGEYRMLGHVSKALYRLQCIDSKFREWGQQYYRDHPSEATQKRLN